jgi:hypothetical protein
LVALGANDVAKQADNDVTEAASRLAEELTQAAAEAEDMGARLWRLEWAQAFRRLADLSAWRRDHDQPD